MHRIFCNLDPHWEFITQVHNHCLDVYADSHVEFWHIGAVSSGHQDGWGDWPRRIAREHLLAELLEAGQVLAETESLCLLISAAASDPELNQELTTLTDEPWWSRCHAVLTLPEDNLNATLLLQPPWSSLFLLTAEPRYRLYSLRLLSELFQQHDHRDHWLLPNENGAFRLDLKSHTPISDCVMQHWPKYAQSLLQAANAIQQPNLDEWRQAVENTQAAAFKPLGLTWRVSTEELSNERLDDQELQKGGVPWSSEPTAFAQTLLDWPLPWFHDSKLPKALHEKLSQYIADLNRQLAECYVALHAIQPKEPELRPNFTRCRAWTLGISDETINAIKQDRAQLNHYRAAIRRRTEKLADFLRRRIDRRTRHRVPGYDNNPHDYRRPWLEEDAALYEARREAKTAARHLVSQRGFWGGGAAVAGLALLPVLILRLPLLTSAGGVSQYFNNPAWWSMDGAWVLVFFLIYLGFALYQVFQRRRRLGLAQRCLRLAAENLWQQNLEILNNLFRYQKHGEAQRRLSMLDEQGEQLLKELTETQTYLNRLHRSLEQQLRYHEKRPNTSEVMGHPFNGQDPRERSPLSWLRHCLEPEDWRRLPEQSIAINGQPDRLKSRYLLGCDEIILTPVPFHSGQASDAIAFNPHHVP